MKKILIVGMNIHGNGAVDNIINCVLPENQANIIYCAGYSNAKSNANGDCNIHNISINDPFARPKIQYRILRKFFKIFKIDDFRLTRRYLFKNLIAKFAEIEFDLVVGVSSRFCFAGAAYDFAKKRGIELRLVYFDPFTNNAFAYNPIARTKEESKWVSYASKILYNSENALPPAAKNNNKFKPFKIPFRVKESAKDGNNIFVYGGLFYDKIRRPDGLIDFAEKIENTPYSIACYSNLNKCQMENITFNPLLGHDAFVDICLKSKALIYIGNKGANSISSKYLEYISLRKPIIGIDVEDNNDVKKYKFYFDGNDSNLISEINKIDRQSLESYDPYVDYPDRKPQALYEELFC